MKNLIKYLIIVLGIVLIIVSVVLLNFSGTGSKKEDEKIDNSCDSSIKSDNYKEYKLEIDNYAISFNFPECLKDSSIKENVGIFKDVDDKLELNVYHMYIDNSLLASSNFLDYTQKEEYPDYYLFVEDKETSDKKPYKVLYGTKVEKDENGEDKQIGYMYQILYPIDDMNSLEFEMFYETKSFDESVFNKIASSISFKEIKAEDRMEPVSQGEEQEKTMDENLDAVEEDSKGETE